MFPRSQIKLLGLGFNEFELKVLSVDVSSKMNVCPVDSVDSSEIFELLKVTIGEKL